MSNLFISELHKQIKINSILWIIIGAVAGIVGLCFVPKLNRHSYNEVVYSKYTSVYEGIISDSTVEAFANRLAEYEAHIGMHDTNVGLYMSDKMTYDEFKQYISQYEIACAEIETVRYIYNKTAYLNSCTGFEPYLFDDTDWSDFLNETSYEYAIMLLAVISIAGVCFNREYLSGAVGQLKVSRYGKKKLCAVKLSIVLMSAFLLCSLTILIKYFISAELRNLSHGGVALGNVLCTESYRETTLWQAYLRDSINKTVGWMMYSVMVCFISVCSRNFAVTIAVSLFMLISPGVILGLDVFRWADVVFAATIIRGFYKTEHEYIVCIMANILKTLVLFLATAKIWDKRD